MTRDTITRRIVANFEAASLTNRQRGEPSQDPDFLRRLEEIEDAADHLRSIAASGGMKLGEFLKLPV